MKTGEVKKYFINMSGWFRAGLTLTLFWILVSIPLYNSYVDSFYEPTDGFSPTWFQIWNHFFPFIKSLPIYIFSCSKSIFGQACMIHSSEYGLYIFIIYPIIFLWIFGMLASWVHAGFQKKN